MSSKWGGNRKGAGRRRTFRRLDLSAETAQELKILTLHRRALTGNQGLQPVDIASDLIHAAWCEYDAALEAIGAEVSEELIL